MKEISNNLTALLKRRGFIYPSSDIYGGFAGSYDYGPLGVKLRNNIIKEWRANIKQNNELKDSTGKLPNIYEIDSTIITHPEVWNASGHITHFKDPITICKKTGKKFRVDSLLQEIGIDVEFAPIEELTELFNKNKDKLNIGDCSAEDLSAPEFVPQLISTDLHQQQNDKNKKTYLRGETCQGIFINYKNIIDSMHPKLPFGISQVGKVFRNEIAPRQFLFRLREFNQLELEYFCKDTDASKVFDYLKENTMNFLYSLGLEKDKLQFKDHNKLIFYAKAATDIEYKYDDSFRELCGVHNRGDYDLTQHSKHSKTKLNYFDDATNSNITPYVIESSIGLERLVYALLLNAFKEEDLKDDETRTLLKLNPSIAPYKIAILPLQRKDGLSEFAYDLYLKLQNNKKDLEIIFDDNQSIGKRYRRQDEIGTPYCITVDYDSIKDNSVTIRERDSMKQNRVKIEDIEKNTTI